VVNRSAVRPASKRKFEGIHGRPTRETILDAAETVVVDSGAHALTLDDVHKRAGISKGGLLHHFRSKEALIDAMIERYIARVALNEDAYRRTLGASGANLCLRAAISQLAHNEPGADRVAAALPAGVANDPDRLSPVHDHVRRRFEAHRQTRLPLKSAAIVELAVVGLTILELQRIQPFDEAGRTQVLAALGQLSGGDGILSCPSPEAGGARL
jgi:AcrR family transcriptional regulator